MKSPNVVHDTLRSIGSPSDLKRIGAIGLATVGFGMSVGPAEAWKTSTHSGVNPNFVDQTLSFDESKNVLRYYGHVESPDRPFADAVCTPTIALYAQKGENFVPILKTEQICPGSFGNPPTTTSMSFRAPSLKVPQPAMRRVEVLERRGYDVKIKAKSPFGKMTVPADSLK